MGINLEALRNINFHINAEGYKTDGLRICEFGNQLFKRQAPKQLKELGLPCTVVKRYFEALGAVNVSIDRNGKNGAVKMDLSQPVSMTETFNVLINGGTIEHVNKWYYGFYNAHILTRPSGVMFHLYPAVRRSGRIKHGIHNFEPEFFRVLADLNNYRLLQNVQIRESEGMNVYMAVLVKIEDNDFVGISKIEELELHVISKGGR